jgi:hypothetical protein
MLTAKDRKLVRDNVVADRVTFRKDGTLYLRNDFFYTHGRSTAGEVAGWTKKLQALGFKVGCMDSGEKWQAWPRDSYWHATFTLTR